MSIDVDALKRSVDIVAIVGSYVPLRKRGVEYVGKCVAHSPDNTPSMCVCPQENKRFVHCHSCGFHEDVIGFIQHIHGVDFQEACRILGAPESKWEPKAPIEQYGAQIPVPERITSKPPPDAGEPNMAIRSLGEPELIFPIRDTDETILGYECRYKGAEKKEIRVWTWGKREGTDAAWGCGHFTTPRPLYGLPRLAETKTDGTLKPVSVFEGPKKAEAGKRLLPPYACLSWTGGANAWHRHDWAPLRGRSVLLWPDADEPGWIACEKLAALLSDPRGLACSVRIVDTHGMPEAWDVADAEAEGWDMLRLIEWAKPRANNYEAPNPAQDVGTVLDAAVSSATPDAGPEFPPEATLTEPPALKPPKAPRPADDDEPLPISMSEHTIGDYFAEIHAEKWRYVKPWGSWFEWRGDGWYKDDTALIDRLAVEMTRQACYWPEARELSADAKRRVNSKRTAGSVRDIAMSHRKLSATIDQWDTDPWLLGVPGGVVNLTTGDLKDARPTDYITKRCAVSPEIGDAPIWRNFLETVTDGNPNLVAFLQRFSGYCLTGETREQSLAFLYGTGQNGKGVFITTLQHILRDYACTADADVFMESDQARHSTEMARLRGARLVAVDETDNAKRWNEKRIKRVTGGGKVEARFMRQDDFEFVPQFKLLFAGNHKPQLRGVGKAIQRRINLIPFTVTIPDEQRDDKLSQKLEAEYPQILHWMLEGCAQWQSRGLEAPSEVVDATARYIEGEDVIGEWLDERAEQSQAHSVERPAAYKNYRAWVEARGERAWSTKAFWGALEERGFTAKKTKGNFYILGMSLKIREPEGWAVD